MFRSDVVGIILNPVSQRLKEFGEEQARKQRHRELRYLEREAKQHLGRYCEIMAERDRLAGMWKGML